MLSVRTCLGLFVVVALTPVLRADKAEDIEFFEKKIRPMLVEHCYKCHSADAKRLRGGLTLDSRAGLLKGGESGAMILPGKASESLLIKALRYDKIEMPPAGKLPDNVINDFTIWIERGAPIPEDKIAIRSGAGIDFEKGREFWAFQPIQAPALPRVNDQAAVKDPIDRFVLSHLEANKLKPVALADKRTLIRRATFDLTGLPPTPEEIDAFLKDTSEDAFARVVDRLLASPRYGERWARHWLDVARYGEDQAHSFKPRLYPEGYRYRDWIVKALNDDMPYDRFIKEQLAADLLEEGERRANLPALGFFAVGPVYYGDKLKFDQYDDRIDTLSRGVLGLTIACARCHDHKFDPISTKDYYALAGVIASSEYAEAPLASAEEVAAFDKATDAAKKQEQELKKFLGEEAKRLKVKTNQVEKKLDAAGKKKLADMKKELDKLKKAAPPKYPIAHALKEGNVRNLKVLIRGNPATQGDEVARSFLTVLARKEPTPFKQGSGRLELAEAIVSKDNPLTARVFVNRLWHHHFGRGLVETTSNFGALGARPSHPELLDHLAHRFMANGWSIKKMHRVMMLSAAYQRSSAVDAHNLEVDPQNKKLWRMNRRRLEVEAWRDAMLAVAGNLDGKLGGPSQNLSDAKNRRRTLYGKISRHDLDSLLRLFDFPDPNITSGNRSETTVALQQLFVFNSDFMHSQARALTERIQKAAPSDKERINHAYVLLFGRPARAREIELGERFLAEKSSDSSPWELYAQILLSANEFMYID